MAEMKVKIAGAAWDGPEEMSFREWAEYEGYLPDRNDEYSFYSLAAAELFELLAQARGFTELYSGRNTTGSYCVRDWEYEEYEEGEDE